MKSKSELKQRIREIEKGIEFERGRLSVIDEQGKDVDASKAGRAKIREMEAVAAAFREVIA